MIISPASPAAHPHPRPKKQICPRFLIAYLNEVDQAIFGERAFRPFPSSRIREIANAILAFPTAAMLLVAFWLYVTRNRRDF